MAYTRIPAAPMNGGVSTQPRDSRLPEQTETSDNTSLFFQRGLEKRPGTHHVSAEGSSGGVSGFLNVSGDEDHEDQLAYFVTIDDDNVFVIIFDDQQSTAADQVQAFNVTTGARVTVTDNTSGAAFTYLAASSVKSNAKIKPVSYGATTLITNQEVVTDVTGTKPGHTVSEVMTTMPIPPGDSDEFLQNDETVQLIDDTTGYVPGFYKVLNGGDNDGSAPFVGTVASGYGTINEGPWYERLEAEADGNSLDATTMPVSLTWNGTAFVLDQPDWNKRFGGDEVTNPSPDFVGEKVRDLAIFQDRLWLGAETVVVSSQAGDIFNFWVDNPGNVVDSDPISLPLGGPQANRVQSLVPVQDTLIVFGTSGAQYEIQSPNAFTPAAANLQRTTSSRSFGAVRPQVVGDRLLFPENREGYSNIWEYFYNFSSDSNVAEPTGLHCEGYIAQNVRQLTVADGDNMAFVLGETEENSIYVYFYYWSVDSKQQSAWCRWTWPTAKRIFGVYEDAGTLYVVFQKDGHIWLEYVNLGRLPNESDADGTLPFPLHMDRKHTVTGVYSASTNLTTWTLAFKDTLIDEVVLGSGFTNREGMRLSVTADNTGTTTVLSASGDWSAAEAHVGASYDMEAQLSQPFVRDGNGQTVPGVLLLKRMEIRHTDATSYDVEITPNQRPTVTRQWVASRIGSALIGQPSQEEHGKFTARIQANAEGTSVTVRNSTPYPSLLTKVEYEGNFVQRRSKIT